MKDYAILIYLIIMYIVGFVGGMLSYSQLKEEYSKLETNYNNMKTEYKWQLESCHQLLGDLQDRVEGGFYNECNKEI